MTALIGYEVVRDWRVALYPAGTTVTAATAAEVSKQASRGRTVSLSSVTALDEYQVLTTTGVLQDVVAVFGTVCVRYRLNPL